MSTVSNQNKIKVVFFGTPAFSVPTLKALLDDPAFEVLGVLTQPDKPAGRGQQLMPSAIKVTALENNLPVHQPRPLRKDEAVKQWLAEQRPDYFVTVAFGQILSQEVLDIPQKGTVNVHASLLPEFRGANPIQQAVLQGKTETGITTMLTDIGIDTGDMLLVEKLAIGDNESMGELAIRMSATGAALLTKTLKAHYAGELTPTPQHHEAATHAPKCDKTLAEIDWSLSAQAIHNQVRAFNPAPGAYTLLEGQRIKILQTQLVPDSENNLKNSQPGQILAIMKEGIRIHAGLNSNGSPTQLDLITIQPAGKKPMPASDWGRNALKDLETQPRFFTNTELVTS